MAGRLRRPPWPGLPCRAGRRDGPEGVSPLAFRPRAATPGPAGAPVRLYLRRPHIGRPNPSSSSARRPWTSSSPPTAASTAPQATFTSIPGARSRARSSPMRIPTTRASARSSTSAIATRRPILRKRLGDVDDRDRGLRRDPDAQRGRDFASSGRPRAGLSAGSRGAERRDLGRVGRLQARGRRSRRRLRAAALPRLHHRIDLRPAHLPLAARRPRHSRRSTPGGARTSPRGARASSSPTRSARRSACLRTSMPTWADRLPRRGRADQRALSRGRRRPAADAARRRRWRTRRSSPARSFSRRPRRRRARGSGGSATIPTRWRAAGCRSGEIAAGAASTAALRSPITPTGRACSRPSRRPGAERVLVTHGYTEPLTRYLREQGLDARALKTAYGDDEDTGGAEATEGEGGAESAA